MLIFKTGKSLLVHNISLCNMPVLLDEQCTPKGSRAKYVFIIDATGCEIDYDRLSARRKNLPTYAMRPEYISLSYAHVSRYEVDFTNVRARDRSR